MTQDSLDALKKQFDQAINACTNLKDLDDLRVHILGKSGQITQMLKALGQLDIEQRKTQGAALNILKNDLSSALDARKNILSAQALDARLAQEVVDVTLPIRPETQGTIHPLTKVIEEIVTYFGQYGFDLASGPDIETEEYNFNALNIPDYHPARQSHDTFYFDKFHNTEGRYLLRTHTSTVQIHTLRNKKPPLRVLSFGRTYRCDYDATHTPMFHQMEGFIVDDKTHMGYLKALLIDFCRHFFNVDELPARFRPSFFPFTEPSAEMDIGCSRENGTLKIGAGKDWLEILGCGMIHPQVLKNCGIDPEQYQGFAFGAGLDRLAMLKYGIPDLRPFFESDTRWLQHYGFSSF